MLPILHAIYLIFALLCHKVLSIRVFLLANTSLYRCIVKENCKIT